MLDLKANPDRLADGVVIEAKLDAAAARSPPCWSSAARCKRGDIVVAGDALGQGSRPAQRARASRSTRPARRCRSRCSASTARPRPGDALAVVENEARARELTAYRERVKREKAGGGLGHASLDQTDGQGQPTRTSRAAAGDQGRRAGLGRGHRRRAGEDRHRRGPRRACCTRAPARSARATSCWPRRSSAPIIGFNVRANAPGPRPGRTEGVEIRYYSIIYDLIDDIKGVLSGMLAPIQRETFLGNAEILQVFDITEASAASPAAGSPRASSARAPACGSSRDDVVVLEGTLQTLKRFKDEVNEVQVGQECGMAFESYDDIREGDVIEIFETEFGRAPAGLTPTAKTREARRSRRPHFPTTRQAQRSHHAGSALRDCCRPPVAHCVELPAGVARPFNTGIRLMRYD